MEMFKHKRFLVAIGLGFLMAGIGALSLGSRCGIRYRRLVRKAMPARGLVTAPRDPQNCGVSSYAGTADAEPRRPKIIHRQLKQSRLPSSTCPMTQPSIAAAMRATG